MFKKLIWPSEAKPNQDQSDQVARHIPEYVTIVLAQQVADAIAASVYEVISASAAQSLCNALLESAHQLDSAGHAQRMIEDHGVVFTNTVGRSFSVAEGSYFYGKDFMIEHYSAIGRWVESTFGELDRVCLDTVETSSQQPFAVCVCY